MNKEAYRVARHVHGCSDRALKLYVHSAVGVALVPAGWLSHGEIDDETVETVRGMNAINANWLCAIDRDTLQKFRQYAAGADYFLQHEQSLNGYVPDDAALQTLLSFAYHSLNPEDRDGQRLRAVLMHAVEVLEVGGILDAETSRERLSQFPSLALYSRSP